MTAEELVKEVQDMIKRGVISPTAEIKIWDWDTYIVRPEFSIDYHCTSYNCLRLEVTDAT